ncbi:MAG TPA: hypothetical protein VK915_04970, partial [Gaiellaceae bacterium]|nr:hypothetical protein [Gaiellaceae bacterium]
TETVAATTGAEGAALDEPEEGETGETEDAGEGEEEAQPGEVVDGDVVVDAAERTKEAGSARVSTSMTVGGDGVEDQTFGGEGVFSFDDDVGEVMLDLGGVEGATVRSARVVFADYVVYYGLPAGFLAGNKRWLKLDPQGLADASAVDAGSLFLGSQADPAQFLLWLRAIGPTARRVGSETVRGEQTTRFDAVVDLRRLASQGPEGQEDAWRAYVESTRERLGLAEIPVQVWVDGDGLVRRLRHGYVFGPEGQQARTSSVTELWDFGVPVSVRTPPPGQVADLADYVRP